MFDTNTGATKMMETIEISSGHSLEAPPQDVRVHGDIEPNHVERRSHPRYAFSASVEAVEAKSRTRIQGRTADLSHGGCYVDTISPFPVETTIKLRMVSENRSLDIPAKVVYALPGMGMGVMFLSTDAEQVNVVEKWIGELSGELEPAFEEPAPTQHPREEASNDKAYYVLQELIIELMRQGTLSNSAGKAMMQKLIA
jgi:hypothetical protein